MILETKHRVVWKGNLWSDIVFTATSFDNDVSSYVGLRVYLEMVKADEGGEEELIPCEAMSFSGRPNFIFLSRHPTSLLGQSFTPELSSVCNFLFNDKCLVGVRVHHDVLSGDFVSLKLVILVATKSNVPHMPHMIANKREEIVERFRLESSKDANLPVSAIDVLSYKSDGVK